MIFKKFSELLRSDSDKFEMIEVGFYKFTEGFFAYYLLERIEEVESLFVGD